MLTWKTVDPKAIYPLERYHAVSGLVIREVGMACTRMCTIYHTAGEAKKAAEQWEGRGTGNPV